MISIRLQILPIIASELLLAAGFISQRQFIGVAISVLIGLLWSYGIWRAKSWSVQIAYVLSVCAAAFAAIAGIAPFFSLCVVLFSLAGWDLARFAPLVVKIIPPETAVRLEKIHLRRLGLTLALGAAAGLAAIGIHIKLSFPAATLLGLITVVFLVLSAREFRRSDNDLPRINTD